MRGITTPTSPTTSQAPPERDATHRTHQRSALWRRLRAETREYSPEGDGPFPGSGRIAVTVGAAFIALCLAIPTCLEIESISWPF
ncbi:hypothetical protein [Actinomyces sp. MRS3W]|uniref:hypothetical protein n=1 Tax=Actinomyces sp. MRS3W TaxID=2800796 RepID=UPI0028FD4B69|nr:hypothetical protein [Actinomyces sp. MRS3W]MDU0348783.1 hypothetical protein [Actinomyces sp. MRS3W]